MSPSSAGRLRIVGVLVVAWVVVFAFAEVGPNTAPVKIILEITMGGRALWARANTPGQSAEGETPASVGLSFLEVGSVGAPGTGKRGVQFGVQLLPAGLTLEIPFFWKDFSWEEVMVPWRAIDTGGLGAVGMAREVGELARFRSVISSSLLFVRWFCGWVFFWFHFWSRFAHLPAKVHNSGDSKLNFDRVDV